MIGSNTTMPLNASVFLSYYPDDRDNAINLYNELTAAGLTLWREFHDNPPDHANWWGAICEAIDGCSSMVLCLSVASLNSTVVGDEWTRAKKQGKRIIPVIVDEVFKHPDVLAGDVVVPRWMTSINIPDLRPDAPERETALNNLVTTLREPYKPVKYKITAKAEQLPHNFVPRQHELEQLIGALSVDDETRTAGLILAIHGPASCGKTILSKAVCRDWRISGAYPDGIFWVTLGKELRMLTPEVCAIELFKRLLDLVWEITDQRPQVQTLDAASERLRQAVDGRKLLIVIDDVWELTHVKPFLVEGKYHAVVITTRSEGCIPQESGVVRQKLDVIATGGRPQPSGRRSNGVVRQKLAMMKNDEALALLIFGVDDWELERTQFKQIAFLRLGRSGSLLPRLLGIVNGALVNRLRSGRTLKEASREVVDRLDTFAVKAGKELDITSDSYNSKASEYLYGRALEIGIERLKLDEQVRYRALGIFPSDVPIYITTLSALWNMDYSSTKNLCEKLARSQLVQDYDERSLTMLDIALAHLAKGLHEAPDLHARLLDTWGNCYALPDEYAWGYYGHHLIGAMRADRLRELLLDINWLQGKLDAVGVNMLIADCDRLEGDRTIDLIKSALMMSAYTLEGDKSALAHQLFGRLCSHAEFPDIEGLLATIEPRLTMLPLHEPAINQANSALIYVLKGHEESICGAQELRDGRLLSWSNDGTSRLWNLDGAALAVLKGHTGSTYGAQELKDGRLLSWSSDGTLRVWSSAGMVQAVLRGHESGVWGACELSNGRLLSWSFDGTLRLWEGDGNPKAVLGTRGESVYGAQELKDGRLLSWSSDGMLRLWSANGALQAELRGHRSTVHGAQELKDGRILSWSEDGTLRLWGAIGTPQAILSGHQADVWGATQLQDGQLLSWSGDGTLRFWDVNGIAQGGFVGGEAAIKGAQELKDGRMLSWSDDGTLCLWGADRTVQAAMRGHKLYIGGAQELKDGRLLSWSGDGTLRLWNSDGMPQKTLVGHQEGVRGALELRDGRLLSWSFDATLRLWSTDNTLEYLVAGHEKLVSGMKELRDGRVLSWSSDSNLRLWGADGTAGAVLTGHMSEVTGALELRDGWLLSWSEDKTLRLWESDGTAGNALAGHESGISGALELRNGWLLSWSGDGTLRLWNADGTVGPVMEGNNKAVRGALELRNGRLLSWSSDGMLRLWNSNGTPGLILDGHNKAVRGALELRDGRLLSWSLDGTLRLWGANGVVESVLEGHKRAVLSALELPDGRLLSWSHDGTLHLWGMDGRSVDVVKKDSDPILLRAWFEKHHTDWNSFVSKYYKGSQHAGVFVRSSGSQLNLYDWASAEQLSSSYVDSEITAETLLRSGSVIALGCANGQVIFLRIVR